MDAARRPGGGNAVYAVIRPAREEELPRVLEMSHAFVEEGCCNGMVKDTLADLRGKRILLALADDEPVGYAYGHVAEDIGHAGAWCDDDRYYEVDEIYVKPAWRDQGAGQRLFLALRREAMAAGCAQLHLNACGRDWKRLLRFYCDHLGLRMWSASLYMEL